MLESPVLTCSVVNPQVISYKFLRRKGGQVNISYLKSLSLVDLDWFKGCFRACGKMATHQYIFPCWVPIWASVS